jgi:hypothetical protein
MNSLRIDLHRHYVLLGEGRNARARLPRLDPSVRRAA